MKISSILCASATTLVGATVFLPACDSNSGNVDAASAYAELRQAVEDCANTRTTCLTSAAGDAAAQAACETAYGACAASAGKGAEEKLAKAAAQCAAQARECRAGSADKSSCNLALKACLGAIPHGDGGLDDDDESDESDESSDGDAASDEDATSDESGDGGKPSDVGGGKPSGVGGGSDCQSQLSTCMEQGGTAKDCAASVRECVATAGKGGDHGKPTDPGSQAQNGTHGKPDAGS
jgi:hypothetical protein